MKIKAWYAVIILVLVAQVIRAQQSEVDSLRAVIKTATEDTNKVKALNSLGWITGRQGNVEECRKYADEAFALAVKIKFKKGIAGARLNKGFVYDHNGQYSAAVNEYTEAIKLREELSDKSGVAFCRNLIGIIYLSQAKYPEAQKEFLLALKLYEETGDKKGISRVRIGIGNLHYYQQEFDEAIKQYTIALEIKQELGNNRDIAGTINNIGVVYEGQKKFKEALEKYRAALKIREAIPDERGIADSRQSIGNVYTSQGLYKEAMREYAIALEIQTQIGDKNGIALSHLNIGYLYFRLKQYPQGKKEYLNALRLSKELGDKQQVSFTYNNLAALDSAMHNYSEAYTDYKNYIIYRDSIFNEANTKKLTQAEMQFDFDKKETETKAEQEKKDAITAAEKRKQQVITGFIAAGLLLVIIFALFVFRSLRITRKQKTIIEQQKDEVMQQKWMVETQKHIIEEKHKEITDSINYAERIQRSFLASKELLDNNLKDHFVYFQPKDVVSGDFYWAAELSNGNFAYVTADSTGHGVPGAIMSILNISSLEKATEKQTEPASILNETRKYIIERLKKDGSAEGGKDGMDCSLVVLDKNAMQLKYAAANNPVWIIREGALLEFASDKMPVGKHDKDQQSFTEHSILVQPGDMVYTFTDGMPDQFGGPKGKKFMYRQLKEFLLSISQLPMQEQKEKLEKALNTWKGELEQVDDVCIIGVRV